jgi:NAD(P)-dependent dehydrogenase (short-subunit alcohol dehydrogenase family)
MLLEGKVAIVTGAGRGIGREHALELARQGARVVVVDPGVSVQGADEEAVGEDPADAVASEIRALGGEALAHKGSVTDWQTCESIVQETIEHFGRLDALVNNAGILRDRMITSMEEGDFDAVIAVHLKGTFQMTRHACVHWRALGKAGKESAGRIVNTVSGAGLSGNVGQANYAAAKAGIAGLTIVTALEMGRYDVTCNAVSPVALTRMSASLTSVEASDDGYHPLHPGISSPVVAYLASDESGWLSGQVLRVDGNAVIRMNGWEQSPDRYIGPEEDFIAAADLVTGIRTAYHAHPTGLVSALKS